MYFLRTSWENVPRKSLRPSIGSVFFVRWKGQQCNLAFSMCTKYAVWTYPNRCSSVLCWSPSDNVLCIVHVTLQSIAGLSGLCQRLVAASHEQCTWHYRWGTGREQWHSRGSFKGVFPSPNFRLTAGSSLTMERWPVLCSFLHSYLYSLAHSLDCIGNSHRREWRDWCKGGHLTAVGEKLGIPL